MSLESGDPELPAFPLIDELTGLGTGTRLKQLMAEHRPLSSPPVVVVSLNITDFKRLNAQLGWQRADLILQAVADRLQQAAVGDVFRWGGDDFVALLRTQEPSAVIDESSAISAVTRLVDAVSGAVLLPVPIRASEQDRREGEPYGRLWRSPEGDLYVSGKVYRHGSWQEVDPIGTFAQDEIDVIGVLFGVRAAASVCGSWDDLSECLRALDWMTDHPTAFVRAGA